MNGKTIVVTRAKKDAPALSTPLRMLGATVIEFPVIAIRPARSWKKLDQAGKILDQYWGIVFTSVNAVEMFFQRIRKRPKHRYCAVGPGTAKALRKHKIRPALVSKTATVEYFAKELKKRMPRGARLLHPCADLANPHLRRTFDCDDIVVYRIMPTRSRPSSSRLSRADAVTFASSETVRLFARRAGKAAKRIPAICIGPHTAQTARREGFQVAAIANPHTIAGLIRATQRALRP